MSQYTDPKNCDLTGFSFFTCSALVEKVFALALIAFTCPSRLNKGEKNMLNLIHRLGNTERVEFLTDDEYLEWKRHLLHGYANS